MESKEKTSNQDDKYILNVINNLKEEDIKPKSKSDIMCAPGLNYEAGSCAKLFVLIELAKAYNYSAQDQDKIKLSSNLEVLNPQKYKAYLVYEINKRVGDKCQTQKCWSKQEFMKYMNEKAREEFTKYTYRPDSPQGRFEWLSTFNINDSMAQYEKKYQGFKFFGAVPMDFADLDLEVGNIKYDRYYKNGITKMGFIFNLDNHDQDGSHWTAMYTDLEKGYIYYFDSFGIKPEKRVRALMRDQARFLNSIGKNMNTIRVDYNKIQHQKENTECGVYSMNFLIRMARGDDFDQLCSNVISDKKINKCRLIYFDKHVHQRK
jgi:predicted lactoylglutathione lyase